jgi:hypothetical protein
MANRSTANALEGETRVGANNPGVQGVLTVESGKPSLGSVLCLQSVTSAGVVADVYLWVSSNGKLRSSTTFPTDTEAGDVVGAQEADA